MIATANVHFKTIFIVFIIFPRLTPLEFHFLTVLVKNYLEIL
jgi:hypothetical protein